MENFTPSGKLLTSSNSLDRKHPRIEKLLWKRSREKIRPFPRLDLITPDTYVDLDPILERLFEKKYPPQGVFLLRDQKKVPRARSQAQSERGRRRLLDTYVGVIQGYHLRRSTKALQAHKYYRKIREQRFSATRFLLKDPKFYVRASEFQKKIKELGWKNQTLPKVKKWSLVFYLQWIFYLEEYLYLRSPQANRDYSRIHQRLRRSHRLRQLLSEKERIDQRISPEDVAEFFDMFPFDYELLLRRVGRFKRSTDRLPYLFWALQYLFLFLNKPYKKIPVHIQLQELKEATLLSFSGFQKLLELEPGVSRTPGSPKELLFHQSLWGEWLVAFATGKKNPPHFIKKNYLKNLQNAEHLSDYFFLIFHDKLPPATEAFPRYKSTLELLRAKARFIKGQGYSTLLPPLWEEEMVSFWKLTLKTINALRKHQALLRRLARKQQKALEEQEKLEKEKAAKAKVQKTTPAKNQKKKAVTRKKRWKSPGKVRPSAALSSLGRGRL